MRFRGVRLAGIAATSLLAAPISAHQRAAAEAQEATLAQSARGPAAIVDAFHSAGVEAGFETNGAPGFRDYAPGYYAAYLLDPDGNNVEALYRDVGNPGHAG